MFILSFLWVITSLPVITIGASTTALIDYMIKIHRGTDSGIFRDYFRSFKNNFRQSTLILLLMAGLGGLIYSGLYFWSENLTGVSDLLGLVMFGLFAGAGLIFLGVLVFVFAVQAVFENTIKATVRTAFIMAIKHFPTTIALLLTMAGVLYLCNLLPVVAYCMLVFGVGFLALIFSVRYLSIFAKYNPTLLPAPDESGGEPILRKVGGRGSKKERGGAARPASGSKVIK